MRSFRRFTACLILTVFWAEAALPFAAEAGSLAQYKKGLEKLIGLDTAEIVEELILKSTDKDITEDMKRILNQTTAWEVEREREYQEDHESLKDFVERDLTEDIKKIQGDMILAQAAFLFRAPGYRESAGSGFTYFSDVYKDRVSAWQIYALLALKTNNGEANGTFDSQKLMQQLNDASLNAYGYRQLLQAGSQTSNFANQEISRIRLDVQRQLAAEGVTAVNERQERADAHAAFRQAVREWQSQSQGKGY